MKKQARTRTVPEWWLAAALLQLRFEWPDGSVGPVASHEEAKLMTAAQVLELFEKDHYPIRQETAKALGMAPEEYHAHWNVVFRPITLHRRKTAKIDRPEIAKSDRIRAAHEETRRILLAKAGQTLIGDRPHPSKYVTKRRWPSRPMPGSKASGWRKPMNNGKAERRP
jgi:hypothetical protein